ncbi:MAG: transposase [Candidatus Eisenbacteria bacterium]|nr:transposase [Candidatus Eisenbacteria bacterium]
MGEMSLKEMERQMSLIVPTVDELVRGDHRYRQMLKLLDFGELTRPLRDLYSELGRGGYPVEQGFRCLLLQYLEDLSDRQLEEHLAENNAGKYFCGFELLAKTPSFSYFSYLRTRIGPKRLAKLFNRVGESLRASGIIRGVFTFVDASALLSRVNVWEARDRALADRENQERDEEGKRKLNNKNVEKYSSDGEARFGCKGKKNFWFGYKRHVSVDMSGGLISKVAVTPANVSDHKVLEEVCPDGGMVFADKAYCVAEAQTTLSAKGCHSGVILKNNMKAKDRDKDRWLSAVRMPFEGVFARINKKARYRGVAKNLFQVLMQALAFNLKRLIRIVAEPIPLIAG